MVVLCLRLYLKRHVKIRIKLNRLSVRPIVGCFYSVFYLVLKNPNSTPLRLGNVSHIIENAVFFRTLLRLQANGENVLVLSSHKLSVTGSDHHTHIPASHATWPRLTWPNHANRQQSSVPPPPPPMPPPPDLCDPSETRPFMDPYGRAKTVRIGKWRWPPLNDGTASNGVPGDDNGVFPSPHHSFLQFKMSKQQNHRHKQSQASAPVWFLTIES